MLKGPAGYPQIDLVGGMEKKVIPEEIQPGINRKGRGHADAENMRGGVSLVHQHLVDNDLEKNRRHQGNGVNKQHRQGNIDKGNFLFENLRDKPAQGKRLSFIAQFIRAFQDIDLTRPDCLKLFAG